MYYVYYYDKYLDKDMLDECDNEETMLRFVTEIKQNPYKELEIVIEGKKVELEPVETVIKYRIKKNDLCKKKDSFVIIGYEECPCYNCNHEGNCNSECEDSTKHDTKQITKMEG